MKIVDFHTHAFPDALAERAMTALQGAADGMRAYHDGRLSSLLQSMDMAGIERAVIANIATKPSQFTPIREWSRQIASPRVTPFASVHPMDPDGPARIREIAVEGFKGVKLHPYYQDFYLDEPRLYPIYEAIQETGLVLLCHTGFDIAFEHVRRCDSDGILAVTRRFPTLKFVASHFGAWEDWEDVRTKLLGQPVYIEVSFAHQYLSSDDLRAMMLAHPADRLLFGTDSPWVDQTDTLRAYQSLDLPEPLMTAFLSGNATRLLNGAGPDQRG